MYSFGCVLYEILSGGDKLLGVAGSKVSGYERDSFVRNKLVDLDGRLLRQHKRDKN